MTSNGLNTSYLIPHTPYHVPVLLFASRCSLYAGGSGFLSFVPSPFIQAPHTPHLIPADTKNVNWSREWCPVTSCWKIEYITLPQYPHHSPECPEPSG